MQVLCSYVVRIYRRETAGVAGLIESVETGETNSFQSAAELWEALCALPAMRRFAPSNHVDEE